MSPRSGVSSPRGGGRVGGRSFGGRVGGGGHRGYGHRGYGYGNRGWRGAWGGRWSGWGYPYGYGYSYGYPYSYYPYGYYPYDYPINTVYIKEQKQDPYYIPCKEAGEIFENKNIQCCNNKLDKICKNDRCICQTPIPQ